MTVMQPVGTAQTTGNQCGTLIYAALDQELDLVELSFRYNWPDLPAFDIRWSDLCFLSDGSGGFNGLVEDRALYQHPGWCVTGLARVVETVPHAACDGLCIGIGKYDIGSFASQFEANAFHGIRS
jgi:hypothetical protein